MSILNETYEPEVMVICRPSVKGMSYAALITPTEFEHRYMDLMRTATIHQWNMSTVVLCAWMILYKPIYMASSHWDNINMGDPYLTLDQTPATQVIIRDGIPEFHLHLPVRDFGGDMEFIFAIDEPEDIPIDEEFCKHPYNQITIEQSELIDRGLHRGFPVRNGWR